MINPIENDITASNQSATSLFSRMSLDMCQYMQIPACDNLSKDRDLSLEA